MKLKIDLTKILQKTVLQIPENGAMEVRDVDAGAEPFLYASGWRGPIYIMVKGMVSFWMFKTLAFLLSVKLAEKYPNLRYVAGNVTGGMIPGWLITKYLELITGNKIDYLYVKGSRVIEKAVKDPIVIVDRVAVTKTAALVVNKLLKMKQKIDFVAGASPGGMALGYEISEQLYYATGQEVPFVYVREKRKKGGQKELITGLGNKKIEKGMTALAVGQVQDIEATTDYVANVLHEADFSFTAVTLYLSPDKFSGLEWPFGDDDRVKLGPDALTVDVEELANFAFSTTNSSLILRRDGFIVPCAACFLFFDNPEANKTLAKNDIEEIYLFTISDLVKVVEKAKLFPQAAFDCFWEYIRGPIDWNKKRGIKRIEKGGTI